MNLGIVFGGRSVEHAVSILSTERICSVLETLPFDLFFYYIDRQGAWYELNKEIGEPLGQALSNKKPIQIHMQTFEPFSSIDLFFPLVHGRDGEDGALQGFFELINKPYIGPGVQSSSICMDKELAKRLVQAKEILVADYVVLKEGSAWSLEGIVKKIGFPCFVKPASLGSSIGISKVYNSLELDEAIKKAFFYDQKILVEQAIVGEEIECALIGSKKIQASFPIKLHVQHDFYSFDAKYIDPNGASIEAPYQAEDVIIKKIQQTAVRIYEELGCESMARIDFFLTKEKALYFNEVNTIPGFTSISGFPLAWERSGVTMQNLIQALVEEALIRHQEQHKKKQRALDPDLILNR